MKKVFSVIMICLIAFSMTSCDIDSTKKADNSKSDKKVEKETAKKYPKDRKSVV